VLGRRRKTIAKLVDACASRIVESGDRIYVEKELAYAIHVNDPCQIVRQNARVDDQHAGNDPLDRADADLNFGADVRTFEFGRQRIRKPTVLIGEDETGCF